MKNAGGKKSLPLKISAKERKVDVYESGCGEHRAAFLAFSPKYRKEQHSIVTVSGLECKSQGVFGIPPMPTTNIMVWAAFEKNENWCVQGFPSAPL